MADRYQDRPYSSDDYGRGGDPRGRTDGDPLAELARLIGQTDPFAAQGRPASRAPEHYQPPAYDDEQQDHAQQDDALQGYEDSYEAPQAPAGPPAWMRRANVQPQPAPSVQQDYAVNSVHPLQRYATQEADYRQPQSHAYPEQVHQQQAYADQAYSDQAYEEPHVQADPSRYDDALYGQLESGQHDYQRDPAYPDDPYAYQSDYPEDELDSELPKKKRGGLVTVAAILALAVVGTGAAFAYKTYLGSPRSGEPPIIKADNTPTKVVPAPSDGSSKVPDRMATGDAGEKIVPREEAPMDPSKSGGPRVVFPPLNPNANPPTVSSVTPTTMPTTSNGATASNGTMPNNEPRKIRTLAVKGDQNDAAPQTAAKQAAAPKPATAPAPAAPRSPPSSANASANQPMSLAPQGAPEPATPPTRMAATNPTQIAPSAPVESGGGGVMVSISSQDSEAAAKESFRVTQSKYPSVLGSRSPVVQRATLSSGKVTYRAMVGPYKTKQEAIQFCTELKAAGGQCFIP